MSLIPLLAVLTYAHLGGSQAFGYDGNDVTTVSTYDVENRLVSETVNTGL